MSVLDSFCPVCGTPWSPEATACSKCGHPRSEKLAWNPPAGPESVEGENDAAPREPPRPEPPPELCPHCGTLKPPGASVCPNCGYIGVWPPPLPRMVAPRAPSRGEIWGRWISGCLIAFAIISVVAVVVGLGALALCLYSLTHTPID